MTEVFKKLPLLYLFLISFVVLVNVYQVSSNTDKSVMSPKSTVVSENAKISTQSSQAKSNSSQMWPSWWNEEKESRLKEEIVIGIITTSKFHKRIVNDQMKSWWTEERRDMVEVFSDVESDPEIPNLIYTHCDSSYHFGLWCKNTHMMKLWQSPRYKNVKWFIRANDDSYYHLENIFEYLETMNHSIPQVIGDVYCYPPKYTYPAGGCGFIMSRAVLDQLDWFAWNRPLRVNLRLNDYWEDVQWGQYLNDTNTRLIQHPGITQGPLIPNRTETLKMYLSFKDKPWPFPWRPLASHQARSSNTLPELHKLLHSMQYTPESPIKFTFPICRCRHGFHSRCLIDHTSPIAQMKNHPCRWNVNKPSCFGPGNYTTQALDEMLSKKSN